MNHWTTILYAITAALLIWYLVRTVRHNPQAFSKENFGKSIYTMGLLTLLLLIVIFLGILFIRSNS